VVLRVFRWGCVGRCLRHCHIPKLARLPSRCIRYGALCCCVASCGFFPCMRSCGSIVICLKRGAHVWRFLQVDKGLGSVSPSVCWCVSVLGVVWGISMCSRLLHLTMMTGGGVPSECQVPENSGASWWDLCPRVSISCVVAV